jgi:hypothetical protein
MKAARPATGRFDADNDVDDDANEPQLSDYFTGGARLSRSAISWMAGGAAGAVAVVVIAIMIVNNHLLI